MTLTIRPVKLNRSIYFRVPNDIADLIGIGANANVTLNLEEQVDRFLLTYSIQKEPLVTLSSPSLQIVHNSGKDRGEADTTARGRRINLESNQE